MNTISIESSPTELKTTGVAIRSWWVTRKRWLAKWRHISCLLCFLATDSTAISQVPSTLPPLIQPATQTAVNRGLQWLADQQHEDGSFGSKDEFAQNVGVTALCGMAFLASGSVVDSGPYSSQTTLCTDYLLGCAASNGFIVESDVKTHGPMYGHGFATMYLSEVYGMSERPELKIKLKQAVELILATQNDQGGWRYLPKPDEADISVTVCQVMALRAARNKGIAVPKEAIDKAVDYITSCQNPDGGFRYRKFDAADSKFPRSAAAIVALYTAGDLDTDLRKRGLQYLFKSLPQRESLDQEYYDYGQYYGALACWHAGDEVWSQWYPAARDLLQQTQLRPGNWSNKWIGDEYATAMALIVLQLPYDYVPIFER